MKTIAMVFAVVALMVSAAFAQNGAVAPYVDAGIGISSTLTGTGSLSASNPNYFLGAGIESSTAHLLLDVNGQFFTGNVRTFGQGTNGTYAATITGTGFLKLGHILVGGGALYNNVVSSGDFSSLIPNRNTFVPEIGGGFQFSRDRITALYELPGRSATGNRTFNIHNEIFLIKSAHVRLTQDVSVNSSTEGGLVVDGVNTRVTGGTAAAGLKFVF